MRADKEMDSRQAAGNLISGLRADAERQTLLKLGAILQTAKEEHQKDFRSYEFSCRRFGDFVSVFLTRTGNKFTTSLNVSKTTAIELKLGNAPDCQGTLGYWLYCEHDNNSGSCSFTGMGFCLPPKEYHYVVRPNLSGAPTRQFVHVDEPNLKRDKSYIYCGHEEYHIQPTKGFARYAEDDQIIFRGIGAVIYAPFGRGQEVLDFILTAKSE